MRASFLTILGTKTSGGVAPPEPMPADYYHTTITVGDGSANAFVYQPEDIDNPPVGGWPVAIFLGGDGTDNSATTVVTDDALSTSNDLLYTKALTITGRRLLSKSVVIKVNGAPVGYGQFGGSITGTGISSGSFSVTSTTPTISVTFSSSQAGNTVTADYVHSAMLIEGMPMYANFGDDFDGRLIMIAVQNIPNDANYDADYFLNAVTYAYNNFTINLNRIYHLGLSRGSIALSAAIRLEQCYKFYVDSATGITYSTDDTGRIESGLAAAGWATADNAGTYTNIANYKFGLAIVHGANDGAVTEETRLFVTAFGGQTLSNYPYAYVLLDEGHNSTVWHNNFYNRKYRTDNTGQAPWDYVDFICRYSLDALESAELAMQQAEKRRYNSWRDIDDWRFAALKISQLSASSEKTALEGRLSTLRTAIGGTYFVVVHSTSAVSNSPYYDVNSMTNHADNQDITDLVDIDGATHSGTSFGTGDNTRTSSYQLELPNSAGINNAGGFPTEYNRYGATINITGGGSLPIETSGFASGTYALRVYVSSRENAEVTVTVNSVTKGMNSKSNSLLGYIEFDGLTAAQLENYTVNMVSLAGLVHFMTVTEIIKYE